MISLLLAVIYLAFISLGLPDGLLGAAWPSMMTELKVGLSGAGPISLTITLGTIVSSLMCDRILRRIGPGRFTAFSVGLTCLALFGFSFSHAYPFLILCAIPYGLGAGGVDAALNNYVSVHYSARHMSWLHCMWGVGASVGPIIMGRALTGAGWQSGYRTVGMIQIALTTLLLFSLPLWKPVAGDGEASDMQDRPLRLSEIVRIEGVPELLLAFFFYIAVEGTAGLWAASYLTFFRGVDAVKAASFASLFFIGMTVGRAINGFLTMRFSDDVLIRGGSILLLFGILALMRVPGDEGCIGGILAIGLGCAPIYPCIIHMTPGLFGQNRSQAIIGVEMASAYSGNLLMPPLVGLLGQNFGMQLYPAALLVFLAAMGFFYMRLVKKKGIRAGKR